MNELPAPHNREALNGTVNYVSNFQDTPQALGAQTNGGNPSLFTYHAIGILQLVLKFYSFFIVLMIVGVFESKRAIVSIFSHLAMFSKTLLSAILFALVLFHETILSLRRNAYGVLNVDQELMELRLPANVKYSHLHSLFWRDDTNQKIRVSDDFQSFEIFPANDALELSNVNSSPTGDKNQGLSLSFISSPGISKTQQLNSKYKEKWSRRPHWWKVAQPTSVLPDDLSQEVGEETLSLKHHANSDEEYADEEANLPKNLATSDFENNKFILSSSPSNQNTENADSAEISPSKKPDAASSNTTKIHSKLKLAIESNRHNALSQYAKNLKSFKTNLPNSGPNSTHMIATTTSTDPSQFKEQNVELVKAEGDQTANK